jgi:hypothetical protein
MLIGVIDVKHVSRPEKVTLLNFLETRLKLERRDRKVQPANDGSLQFKSMHRRPLEIVL